MGGQITPGPQTTVTREEWLEFVRDVVLEQDGYTSVSVPELRAVAAALTSAEITLAVARDKLKPGDADAAHWVKSAVEELFFEACELAEKYGIT